MKNLKSVLLLALAILFFTACKKDKLQVNETKVFIQSSFRPQDTMPGTFTGWVLTLEPDGSGKLVSGGDIVSAGNYDVKGANLKFNSLGRIYNFDIVSDTELREKELGVRLVLRK